MHLWEGCVDGVVAHVWPKGSHGCSHRLTILRMSPQLLRMQLHFIPTIFQFWVIASIDAEQHESTLTRGSVSSSNQPSWLEKCATFLFFLTLAENAAAAVENNSEHTCAGCLFSALWQLLVLQAVAKMHMRGYLGPLQQVQGFSKADVWGLGALSQGHALGLHCSALPPLAWWLLLWLLGACCLL